MSHKLSLTESSTAMLALLFKSVTTPGDVWWFSSRHIVIVAVATSHPTHQSPSNACAFSLRLKVHYVGTIANSNAYATVASYRQSGTENRCAVHLGLPKLLNEVLLWLLPSSSSLVVVASSWSLSRSPAMVLAKLWPCIVSLAAYCPVLVNRWW